MIATVAHSPRTGCPDQLIFDGTSELETQGIRPFQVAAPRGVVRAVHGVEVLALDVLDSRIRQRELVNHHAHGVAEARVVGALVEDRRLDDQRLLVREPRLTAVDVAAPGLRR